MGIGRKNDPRLQTNQTSTTQLRYVNMRIHVTAKPGSKKAYVKKVNETHFIVSVTQLPQAGEANEAIIKSLAGYFEMFYYSLFAGGLFLILLLFFQKEDFFAMFICNFETFKTFILIE